jgi:hypothetical protein
VSFRLEERDLDLVGLANGGNAFSVNGDDGTQNYDKGLVSNAFKLTTEIEFDLGDFGGFFRGRAFYDIENEDRDRERTPLSEPALGRVGSRADLLDAYLWKRFEFGEKPAEFRVGEQVVSWGESTFIQGGINAINPVDVSALRVPGAEIRDALLPEGIVWASFTTTENTAVEVFYQYDWDDTEIDPPGSYFSTDDFAGDGGSHIFLGFGDSSDLTTFPGTDRPFLGVPRGLDREPEQGGQYGLAFRWLIPALGETELGFYYINYHSRVPIVSGRTGTLGGAIGANGAGAATVAALTTLALGGLPQDAINDGIAAGVANGASPELSAITATAVVGTQVAGGDGAAVGRAFATDAYAQTAQYFLEYPEDIELFGMSFNTQLGRTGIALQGEASHRLDAPLQVDGVELILALLSPISNDPANPANFADNNQIGDYTGLFATDVPGLVRLDVTQIQATTTKVFGPMLGADEAVLLGEGAVTYVHDLPDKNVLRLEGPGTGTSGNPIHSGPGGAHAGKPAEPADHFADSTSWGYRIAGRLTYNRAIGPINLLPQLSWQHDVSGISPGPGGSFLKNRKAITAGVTAEYLNRWSANLGYTRYFGAGRYNLIHDRDFIEASLKYSF